MNTLPHIFGWLYIQSLKLYPAKFRAKFGEEMQAVFVEAALETKSSPGKLLAFFGREIRDLPDAVFRAHWFFLTHKELNMATHFKRPKWFFYPGWVGFSILASPLAFLAYFPIIAVITHWVGDRIQVNGQTHITEDYLFPYIFFPMVCLVSGLLQYILLRRYAPKMGWWILATTAGGLFALAAIGLLQSVLDSFLTSAVGGTLTLIMLGGVIGLSQWIFLRQRISSAGWWIFASVLGWGLASLGALSSVKNGHLLAQLFAVSLPPALVTSFAWWYLLKQPPKSDRESLSV